MSHLTYFHEQQWAQQRSTLNERMRNRALALDMKYGLAQEAIAAAETEQQAEEAWHATDKTIDEIAKFLHENAERVVLSIKWVD